MEKSTRDAVEDIFATFVGTRIANYHSPCIDKKRLNPTTGYPKEWPSGLNHASVISLCCGASGHYYGIPDVDAIKFNKILAIPKTVIECKGLFKSMSISNPSDEIGWVVAPTFVEIETDPKNPFTIVYWDV